MMYAGCHGNIGFGRCRDWAGGNDSCSGCEMNGGGGGDPYLLLLQGIWHMKICSNGRTASHLTYRGTMMLVCWQGKACVCAPVHMLQVKWIDPHKPHFSGFMKIQSLLQAEGIIINLIWMFCAC